MFYSDVVWGHVLVMFAGGLVIMLQMSSCVVVVTAWVVVEGLNIWPRSAKSDSRLGVHVGCRWDELLSSDVWVGGVVGWV